MKVAVLSVALLCSALSATATQVKCGVDDTLLPNPDDCGSFYACDNGVPRLTLCPPTLHFNSEALVCDRPENANCQASSSEEPNTPTTDSPTTVKPTTATSAPTTSAPTRPPTTVTTSAPTTAATSAPTTAATSAPTTAATSAPTTAAPTTAATNAPTTAATNAPTTVAPSTTQSTSRPTTTRPTTTRRPTTTSKPTTSTTQKPTTPELPPTTPEAPSSTSKPTAPPTTPQPTTPELPPTTPEAPSSTSKPTAPPTTPRPTTPELPPTTPEAPSSTSKPTAPPTTPRPTTPELPPTTPEAPSSTSKPTAPPTTPEPTTPELPSTTPEAPTGCPANGSDIIPNPEECSSFLVCINGANTTVPCPSGMLFNADLKACDVAENVTCETTTTPGDEETTTEEENSTTEGTTEGADDVTTENSTTEGTTDVTTDGPGSETTTDLPEYKPECPAEGYAVLENPETCSSFYVCINGNYGLVKCPNGFDFNPETVDCDLPADPQCRAGSTEEPPTTPDPYIPPCPENGTIQLPSPSDCNAFYICINGNYARLTCPEEFNFNATLQKCVHPEQSTCSLLDAFSDIYFKCEEDGSFPDPEDCGSYYVCAGDQLFPMQCPGGLYFDPELGSCNNPEEVQCQVGPTSSTSVPTTSPPTNNGTSSTSPTTATEKPTTNRPSNEPDCPSNGTAFLPDPEDCTKFFVCIEGDFDEVECPEGYGFSQELGTCDLAENVQCGDATPPPVIPDCPSTGSAKLPNPADCGSYYYCINGQAALINCPGELKFDENTGTCTATAQCSTGTPTPTPSSTSAPTTLSSTQKPNSTSTTPLPTSISTQKPTSAKPTAAPTECEEEGQLLPNPDSCTSFLMCANGQPVKVECPPGLQFNAALNVCDQPESANCSDKSRNLLTKFLTLWT